MGINRTTLLTDIADDLSDSFGDIERAAGQRLDRSLDKAVSDLWVAFPWTWIIGSTTITTTDGTLGPYDLPSDFDNLVVPERIDRFYAYPQYSIPNPIQDGANGEQYDITWNRAENKLYFPVDPGAKPYTLWYRKDPPAKGADLSAIPTDVWICNYLSKRSSYYLTSFTPDWANESQRFFAESESILKKNIDNIRKGQSRQRVRTPRNPYGLPMYLASVGRIR